MISWVLGKVGCRVPVVLLQIGIAWLVKGGMGILNIGSYVYHSDVIAIVNVK